MIWADLPPSIHIEDRRGEAPQPMTIAEIFELLQERRLSDVARKPCELAIKLGIGDIR
jgi:hypothetical protein